MFKVTAGYVSQGVDVNISLSAITLLWNAADAVVRSRHGAGEPRRRESAGTNGGVRKRGGVGLSEREVVEVLMAMLRELKIAA